MGENHVLLGLEQPGSTCNDCRWKIERHDCPWNYDYDDEETPWAEDCCDFRNIRFPESKFEKDDGYNAGRDHIDNMSEMRGGNELAE